MAEMVVNGVSTRKVEKVVETLCGVSISKSAVSELCKEIDASVNAFRDRPLGGHYPFVAIDATYFKVREDHRIISKAFMVAYATSSEGLRDIIGFGVYPNESTETWTRFLQSLKDRGLSNVLMFISDSHEGIKNAIAHIFPDTPWQRCQFHFTSNILDKTPKKYIEGLKTELRDMFTSRTITEARKKRNAIISDYRDVAEAAMDCLDEGFEDAMTVMVFPVKHRKHLRTTNCIERLNRELKRRSKVIGIFPNTRSLNRLMGAVLLEINEKKMSRYSVFSFASFKEIEACSDSLQKIAKAQQKQLIA